MVMQPMILPMVLTIAESQDKNDFELSTLPALVPVLSTAAGETLLLLVKHAELIINKASQEHLVSQVLPMLVRAYDDTDARMQEEVLKKTVSLAKQLNSQLVKQAILPRVHGLALKTTVAAVRVNALLCLGDMVPMLDKPAVIEILQIIQRCTAVDRSAPTLMCTLGVANAILKQHGVEFAADHVLPLLTPLLIAQQLNVQQFAKYMLFVKDVLRKIEEKRGVTVTDSGIPEVKSAPPLDGHRTEPVKKSISAAPVTSRSSVAWDEDWVATRGSATDIKLSTTASMPSIQPAISNQPIKVNSEKLQSSTMSVPAVDLEWPPRSSSDAIPRLSDNDKQNQMGGVLNASFDDIDPFADWPPRPSGSSSATAASNNGTISAPSGNKHVTSLNTGALNGLNYQPSNNTSWAFNTPNSTDPLRKSQVNSTSNSSVLNSGLNSHSIGFQRNNQGISTIGNSSNKSSDLGLIFSSSKSEQTAPRLAPPPLNAVGRGRGRGRGNQGPALRSSHAKSSSEQPPLLDLL